MSHYRNLGGGKRDANEPEIMKRFRFHGWHPEQISGNRLWDLIVFKSGHHASGLAFAPQSWLVDVKMPDGKVTDSQKKKWGELRDNGIPVYVVRTAEDVDALVRGELAAWEPLPPADGGYREWAHATDTRRQPRPSYTPPRKGDAAKARAAGALKALEEVGYIPPRSKTVDAAKEAEETFAPPCTNTDCKVHR